MPMPPIQRNSPEATSSVPPARVVLDSVAFDNGEVAGPDRAHAFESWSVRLNAEKALATILAATRNDPSKRDSAWAEVNKVADQLEPEDIPNGPAGHIRAYPDHAWREGRS